MDTNQFFVPEHGSVAAQMCPCAGRSPIFSWRLEHVVNAFDPWPRDRGDYYDLHWNAREDAKQDEAFKGAKM